MNFNTLRRTAASLLTFAMMLMMLSPTLVMANSAEKTAPPARLNPLAPSKALALSGITKLSDRKDFSREELEQMRSALLDLVESNRELSALFSPKADPKAGNDAARKASEFDAVREQILKMSDKDLTTMRSVMNPAPMREKLARSRAVIAEFMTSSNTTGLPGINSYCGAPVSSSVIAAADAVYFIAESVRDIAQDGCNEVIVILGEGGNGRLVCLVTDAVYIIAKGVYAGVHFCDDDYAASVGEANYDRLGHIHSDLEASVAADDANKTAIVNNDNTNKDTIVNNDNTNKNTIVANDNANKTTIVNNDNTNTANLTALITAALNAIITNANANKDELKFLVLRTQIEADLAAADSATPVALFQTPSTTCTTPSIPNPLTQCGYLDLVGAIVRETIANQGGPNMAAAQALLVQGDTQRSAGQFRAAYTTYRKAYKTSSK